MGFRKFIALLMLVFMWIIIPTGLSLATPVATVAVSDATAPIGGTFTFSVTFDNTTPDNMTGYGPFIDVIIPVNGADLFDTPPQTPDGITTINSITFAGSIPANNTILTFPAGPLGVGPCSPTQSSVNHPLAESGAGTPFVVCGTPGDQLVVVELPFGSFAPSQPPATVNFNVTLDPFANLDTPLTIRARGGFHFGDDPLDNPCCDPSIVNPTDPNSNNWSSTGTVTPTLISASKTTSGDTPTGPNYPNTYTVTVDVLAPGQTVNGVVVTDNIDETIIVDGINPGTGTLVSAFGMTPPIAFPFGPVNPTSPNNEIVVDFGSVVGGSPESFTIDYHVPQFDFFTTPVIDPFTGDDTTSVNNALVAGSWTPLDPDDAPVNLSDPGVCPTCTPSATQDDHSIRLSKSSAVVINAGNPGVTPGDVIEYTLNFAISDYFTFTDIEIVDTFSDGQRLDPSSTTFTVTDRVDAGRAGSFAFSPASTIPQTAVGGSPPAAPTCATFAAAPENFIINEGQREPGDEPSANDDTDGTNGDTTLTFCVSQALVAAGAADGILQGGHTQGFMAGPATGTITYRVTIEDQFVDTYPSGDPSIDHGDGFTNDALITGRILDNVTLNPNDIETDPASGTLTISQGTLSKSVVAINGGDPFAESNPPIVRPGDEVTYQLTYSMPASDFENFQITDLLPQPIFDATEMTTFTDFISAGLPASVPPAGTAFFGPSDSFRNRCFAVGGLTCLPDVNGGAGGIVPDLTVDPINNSMTFFYGDFDDFGNVDTVMDILFTVTVTDVPFADGLFLTNQAESTEGSTNGGDQIVTEIIQVEIGEPVLDITKGIVAADAFVQNPVFNPNPPGPVTFFTQVSNPQAFTTPINTNSLSTIPVISDLSGLDAGDIVTFAVILENTGQHSAFDISVRDQLPPGFIIPPTGPGLNLQVWNGALDAGPGPGGSTFTTTPVGATGTHPSGLFDDGFFVNDPVGAPACQSASPTSGRNIVVITYDLQIAGNIEAGSLLMNFAELTSYANTEGGQDFIADGAEPNDEAIAEILTPTVSKGTPATNVRVGDLFTYTVDITVPEGQMTNFTYTDNLDPGLALVSLDSITPSSGDVTTSVGGGFPGVIAGISVINNGGDFTLDFGILSNSNNNNQILESLQIVYTVVVVNDSNTANGSSHNNLGTIQWSLGSDSDSAPNVTVIEPLLEVIKDSTPMSADAGDTISYSITVQHTGASTSDAHNLNLVDMVPAPLINVSNLNVVPAATIDNSDLPNNLIDLTFDLLALGNSITITFDADVPLAVTPGQMIDNIATVTWTSLPGDVTTPQSPFNAVSTERTGNPANPGGAENDYTASGNKIVDIFNVAPDKTIIQTSEAHTPDIDDNSNLDGVTAQVPLAIGEVLRYQLATTIPEGTAPNFIVLDTLSAGIDFFDDTNFTLEFSSTDVTSSNAALNGAGSGPIPIDSGSQPGVVTFAPGPRLLSIDLGTLTNTNTDNLSGEAIIIRFNAVVLNNTTTIGDVIANQFDVEVNGTVNATSTTAEIVVVEPVLTILKDGTPMNGDAGDTITFTVTIDASNVANTTDAFDVRVLDTLNAAFYQNVVVTNINTAGSTAANPANTIDASAGNTIDITIDRLEPGGQIVITYTADLTANVTAEQLVDNTAQLTWTSLPGTGTAPNPTNSDTPGGSGAADGERTGDDGVGGAPNGHADESTKIVTIDAMTAQKSVTATSEGHTSDASLPNTGASDVPVTIGEIVRYQLAATLPEGTSFDLTIQDQLANGVQPFLDDTMQVTFVSANGFTSTNFGAPLEAANAGPVALFDGAGVPQFTVPFNLVNYNGGTNFIEFTLGDIVNNDSDGDIELIIIDFNVLVINTNVNNLGDIWANNFDVLSDDQGGVQQLRVMSNSVNIVVQEPVATVTKTINTTLSVPSGTTTFDAGDTVVYDIVVAVDNQANQTAAFDLNVLDGVDANLNLDSVTFIGVPGTTITTDNSILGTPGNVNVDINQLLAGESLTIRVSTTVLASVTPGQIIANTSDLIWTSLPGPQGTTPNPTGSTTPGVSGADNGERNDDDAPGTPDDYAATSTVNLDIDSPIDTVKTIDGTSEAHTPDGTADTPGDPRPLAVGEVITYRLVTEMPELTSPDVLVTDILAPNIEVIPGTARISYLADNAMTVANVPGILNELEPTTGVMGSFNPGNRELTFSLGQVVNNDGDGTASAELLIIEFDVVVVNTTDNTLNAIWANDFSVDLENDGTDEDTSNAVNHVIQEPLLTIDKIINGAVPFDAGDTVTYDITVTTSNTDPNSSTGFDIRLTDQLNAHLDLTSVTLVAPPAGVVIAADNSIDPDAGGGDTVDITINMLAPGESVVVRVVALMTDTVSPGEIIDNKATIEWTSLPGPQGTGDTTPGNSGDTDGERTGDVTGGAGAENDYMTMTAIINFTTATPTVVKGINTTSLPENDGAAGGIDPTIEDVNIGEEITFEVTAILLEGTDIVTIIDTLPTGLTPLSAEVISIGGSTNAGDNFGGNITGSSLVIGDTDLTSANITIAGQVVTFDFGTVVNTADNVVNAADELVVHIVVRVDDIPGNAGGVVLDNDVELQSNSTPVDNDNEMVEIIEPLLQIDKSSPTTTGDGGDTVTFTVIVDHAAGSGAPAYNVVVQDLLTDPNLALIDGTVTAVTSGAGTAVVTTGNTGGDTTVRIDLDVLELGATLTITFDALINPNVPAAVTIINLSSADYDSAPTNGRPGIQETDDHQITTDTLSFTKAVIASSQPATDVGQHDPAITDLTIGETVTFEIVAEIPEGDNTITITDILPGVLQAVSAEVFSINAPIISPNLNAGDDDSSAFINFSTTTTTDDTVTFDFGLVDNTPDGGGTENIVVLVTARVMDDPANDGSTGTVLTNTATIDFNGNMLNDTADVEVVEPVVNASKTFVPDVIGRGQALQMILVVDNLAANNATAPAFDLQVLDTLDAFIDVTGVTIDTSAAPGTTATDNSVITAGFGGPVDQIVIDLDLLAIDGVVTITVDLLVDSTMPIPPPQVIMNVADVASDTIPVTSPDDAFDRDDLDSPTDDLTVDAPTLTVSKTDSVDPVVAGNALTYTIDVQNTGTPDIDATNVVLTDTFPPEFSVTSVVTTQGTCLPLVGNTLTCNLGDMPSNGGAGSIVTITVTGTVAASTPDGTTITNVASVTANEGNNPNDGDTTTSGDDELAEEPTLVIREVDLQIVKTANTASVMEGDNFQYTLTVTNNGPSDAANVTVSDPLPPEVTFIDVTPGLPTCSEAVGIVDCILGSMAAGATRVITIEVTVNAGTSGTTITNTATVITTDNDIDNSNDSDDEMTPVDGVDIAVTKVVDDNTPDAGDQVTYTITVENLGPADATGVAITDTLPTDVTFVSPTNPNICVEGPVDTLVCTIGDLDAGDNITIDVTVDVDLVATGTLTNNVAVTAVDQTDNNPANDTDDEDITVSGVDVGITKVVDDNTPGEGDTITYTLTVDHNNGGPADNVTVTDTQPAGVTFQSVVPAPPCTLVAGTVTCNFGTMNLGDTEVVTITATVDAGTAGQTIINTANVSTTSNDADSTNNDDTANITVDGLDIAVTKVVDNNTPNEGDTVVFTVTVENLGPADATNVEIIDTLPTGLTYVAPANPNVCVEAPVLTLTCAVGNLAAGASTTIDISATVDAGAGALTQPLSNTVTLSNVDQTDTNPNNNDDMADVSVSGVDVGITKDVDDATPNEGDTITYTLTVTHNNGGPADNVTVTDTEPAGVTFQSVLPNPECALAGGTVTCNFGTMNPGDSNIVTITATVNAGAGVLGQPITNTSSVSTSSNDADSTNNDDDADITIGGLDIAVTKVVDNAGPSTGDTITYTITVENLGPGDATGVEVTEDLPIDGVVFLDFVSSNPSQGTYDEITGIWTVGSLSNGQSETLQISVTVLAQSGTIPNTAFVSNVDQTDNNPNNDSDDASITIDGTDLEIEKVVDNSQPNQGDQIRYTITVRNNGPADATGVTVNAPVPAGLIFVADNAANQNDSTGNPTSYDSTTGVWTIGNLDVGDQVRLRIDVTVDISIGTIVCDAVVFGDQAETDTTNNVDSATILVGGADLSLTKIRTSNEQVLGDPVQYQIRVRNSGPNATTNVEVTDFMPGDISYISATSSQGTVSAPPGTPIVWTVGALAVGQQELMTVTGQLSGLTGDVTNIAEVTASDQPDPDSTPNNGVASEDDQASTSGPSVFDPPFGRKFVNDTGFPELEWTMVWINSGNTTAAPVTITDDIPAGTSYVPGSLTCEARGASTQTRCAFQSGQNRVIFEGSIAPDPGATDENDANNEVVITFRTVANDGVFEVNNVAELVVTGTNFRQTASASFNRGGGSDSNLAIVKSSDPPFAGPGDDVRWDIIVTNDGPNVAQNVVVTDQIPDSLEIISVSSTAGNVTRDGQNITFTIDTLDVGQRVTITVQTRISDDITVPFIVTNIARLDDLSAEARVVSVDTLPATGDSPISLLRVTVLLIVLAVIGLLVITTRRWWSNRGIRYR